MNNQHQILLVEDNLSDAMLVREALLDAKVDNVLHMVHDGESAINFLRSAGGLNPDHVRPGLILLDLYMPHKNGHQVLEEIKSDDDLKTIPVVVMTSSQDEMDIEQAYKLQANSYVVKPVDFNKLVKVIESIESFWLKTVELPK